jgi:hypothetical protein
MTRAPNNSCRLVHFELLGTEPFNDAIAETPAALVSDVSQVQIADEPSIHLKPGRCACNETELVTDIVKPVKAGNQAVPTLRLPGVKRANHEENTWMVDVPAVEGVHQVHPMKRNR